MMIRLPRFLAPLLAASAAAHGATDDLAGSAALRARQAPPGAMSLEEIGVEHVSQRRGAPRAGRSIRDKPIMLGGVEYPRGIGTRSISELVIDLKGNAARFVSMVGIDDEVRNGVGSVTFEVWADDARVAASGLMRAGDAPKLLSAGLEGARVLTLLVDDGGDTSNDDEVAWAGAMIELAQAPGERPKAYVPPSEALPAIAPPRHFGRACDSRSSRNRRHTGTAVSVQSARHWQAAIAIQRPRLACGSRDRCVHRNHHRQNFDAGPESR